MWWTPSLEQGEDRGLEAGRGVRVHKATREFEQDVT